MNSIGLDGANLESANMENLTSLWKQMGIRAKGQGEPQNASASWPNRHWFDDVGVGRLPHSAIEEFVSRLPENAIVPVWGDKSRGQLQIEQALVAAGFSVSLEQTAMYLDLDSFTADIAGMELETVVATDKIRIWTDVASEAFGYEIDRSVIERLVENPSVQLLLGYSGGRPAATAMLYKTAEVIGVHLVGVAQEHRGKGIGHSLMLRVIELGRLWQGRYITLQASEAGEGIYRRLGFTPQFCVRSYMASR